jgi:hypothetical protein
MMVMSEAKKEVRLVGARPTNPSLAEKHCGQVLRQDARTHIGRIAQIADKINDPRKS